MKISVVIPCRNEVDYIDECINAIYNNTLPENATLLVYIIDGMSDDGTRLKILKLKEQFPKLEMIDNVQQQTPFAFNLGIVENKKAV